MPGKRTQRAFSAGGVIFRAGAQQPGEARAMSPDSQPAGEAAIEVVLVGRSHSGIWALPKGTPQQGETAKQVALREVREETGLHTRILANLGSVHYSFLYNTIRYEKEVRYFLMEPVGGDLSLHDAEYDEVRWFPLAEAYQRLTYETDSQVVRRAEERIRHPGSRDASSPSGHPQAEAGRPGDSRRPNDSGRPRDSQRPKEDVRRRRGSRRGSASRRAKARRR